MSPFYWFTATFLDASEPPSTHHVTTAEQAFTAMPLPYLGIKPLGRLQALWRRGHISHFSGCLAQRHQYLLTAVLLAHLKNGNLHLAHVSTAKFVISEPPGTSPPPFVKLFGVDQNGQVLLPP